MTRRRRPAHRSGLDEHMETVAARTAPGRQVADLGQPPDRHRGARRLRPAALPAGRVAAAQGTARRACPFGPCWSRCSAIWSSSTPPSTRSAGRSTWSPTTPCWPACCLNGWGNMFDAGYFWHYNELWIGGAAGPGEKGHGSRDDPHRLHHADRRGDRVPADEAVGPPVDDHHLLDGRGDLVPATCST